MQPYFISIIVLVFTFIVAKIVAVLIRRSFKRASALMKVNPTRYAFLRHFFTGLIYVMGFAMAIYLIPPLRSLSTSIFAGAGIFAVVIGFASQHAFANIISGVFIVMFKPFKVDDMIKVGDGVSGVVEDITLRHTVIRTFENKRIVIPNSVISEANIENSNLTDDKICKFIELGISYDSDVNLAMKLMKDLALAHPLCLDTRTKEEKKQKKERVDVRIIGFGDSSVNLRAWVWAKDYSDAFLMSCDLNKSIKESFDANGIEIPFPHRTIIMKK